MARHRSEKQGKFTSHNHGCDDLHAKSSNANPNSRADYVMHWGGIGESDKKHSQANNADDRANM